MTLRLLDLAQYQSFSSAQITELRQQVRNEMLARSTTMDHDNFESIHTRDLRQMFDIYDEVFFDCSFREALHNPTHQLHFRLSKRMTRVGGTTSLVVDEGGKTDRQRYEIAVSSTLLFSTSFAAGQGARVGGLKTHHRLDALQRIFEHELIHLVELRLWSDSSCAAKRFRSMVFRLFGHLESNHQLRSPAETAHTNYGIGIGDFVEFRFRGRTIVGIINRIRQRATVLVEHPRGDCFDDGRRYLTYYVPLAQLRPAQQRP